MPDPAIEEVRQRVRSLKQYVTTPFEVEIHRASTRAHFKRCVDDYFARSRSSLRNVIGESRELTHLDESMRKLLTLSQTKTMPSDYRAELQVLEECINAVEVAATRQDAASQGEVTPKTAFDWIRRVEHAFRNLIVSEARSTYQDVWPARVEQLLGDSAIEAHKTMSQRGVTAPEELIHYTQLKDVVDVIAHNFSRYAPCLGMNKKQFNTLMGPILKGRTEEAHHRPEHLWPEMEQHRVKLHCHDLLDAMRKARDASST